MTTFEKVREIIQEQLSIFRHSDDDIKLESRLNDDLGADSLDLVEIVLAVEEEFNFCIPDEIAEQLKTVKDIVDYIEKEKGC